MITPQDFIPASAKVVQQLNSLFNKPIYKILEQQKKTISTFQVPAHLKSFIESINPTFTSALTRSIALQPKWGYSSKIYDAIYSVNRKYGSLYESLIHKNIVTDSKLIPQIYSMQYALGALYGDVISTVASQGKWNSLENFEEITSQATAINEQIVNNNGITIEIINEIKELIKQLDAKVDKIEADINARLWKVLAVLGFLLTVVGEVRNYLPKPNYATKEEVVSCIQTQFSLFEQRLKEKNEYKVINRKTVVKLKPKHKSASIERLPAGFEVTILQDHHKWVYINYKSPKDSLPQTGWILKKYLTNPETVKP